MAILIALIGCASPDHRPHTVYVLGSADLAANVAVKIGASGKVQLDCTSDHGALVQCTIVSEAPDRQGFGHSALQVANALHSSKARQNEKLAVTLDYIARAEPVP